MTSSPLAIGRPLMATMASPPRNPACCAGHGTLWPLSTQSVSSCPMRLVTPLGTPRTSASPDSRISASSKFISGPAARTAMRCHTDLARNVCGPPLSSSSSPASLTYPPNGTRLMAYTVSPRVTPTSFGPNPTANACTVMPTRLATRKCPSSWAKIMMPNAMIAAIRFVDISSPDPLRPGLERAHPQPEYPPRSGPVHRPPHRPRDVEKPNLAGEKLFHGDFVTRVEDRWHRPAGRQRLISVPEARIARQVWLLKGQRQLVPGQFRSIPGQPGFAPQRVGDDQPHVGRR